MVKKNRAMLSSAETDSDSSSSSSEGEELPPSAADKKLTAHKKPAEPAAQKETDSESDSDDSDSPVKPMASKPMDDSSKLRKPRSKTNYKPVASPPKTPAKRAPSVEEEKENLKKPKREGRAEEEGKKSALFQRLWSDDDEIVILKGMLEYKEKKGSDPMADANDFHDFIKSLLHINVDRSQMVSKVRRLKKRYVNSVAKKKTFTAHERNAFELSKKIWGNSGQSATADGQTKDKTKSTAAAGSTARRSTVAAINGVMASPSEMKDGGISGSSQEEVGNPRQFIGKASISMGLDENIVKMGLGLCNEDKKAEIEDKWKQLHLEESNLWVRKLDLAREESNMVVEALKIKGEIRCYQVN